MFSVMAICNFIRQQINWIYSMTDGQTGQTDAGDDNNPSAEEAYCRKRQRVKKRSREYWWTISNPYTWNHTAIASSG